MHPSPPVFFEWNQSAILNNYQLFYFSFKHAKMTGESMGHITITFLSLES